MPLADLGGRLQLKKVHLQAAGFHIGDVDANGQREVSYDRARDARSRSGGSSSSSSSSRLSAGRWKRVGAQWRKGTTADPVDIPIMDEDDDDDDDDDDESGG